MKFILRVIAAGTIGITLNSIDWILSTISIVLISSYGYITIISPLYSEFGNIGVVIRLITVYSTSKISTVSMSSFAF